MPKYTLPPTLRQILSTPSETALDTFDPWNSVSTGHQRAEGRSVSQPSGWRGIRNRQITGQFGRGGGGRRRGGVEVGWKVERDDGIREGKRRKLGTGSGDRDIRSLLGGVTKRSDGGSGGLKRKSLHEEGGNGDSDVGVKGRKEIRTRDEKSEGEAGQLVPELTVQKGGGALCFDNDYNDDKDHDHDHDYDDDCTYDAIKTLIEEEEQEAEDYDTNIQKQIPAHSNTEAKNDIDAPKPKQIFAHLSIYINGSTMPVISDYKLKHLLASHGANISMDLARRRITHVIIGCPAAGTQAKGAGGGLAGGKLQREIQRVGGKGVKFVGVQWVLESIKAGRRLPEARFADLHMASSKQRSVFDEFRLKPVPS